MTQNYFQQFCIYWAIKAHFITLELNLDLQGWMGLETTALMSFFFFFYKDLQRSISRNNHMASSRPEQHATSVLCKTHFNGTDCCTLYNSSPVELPQQESGNVCTWKWQLNVCVHLCVLLVGSESSFTDGEECPQVREDWDKDMKRGWPGSQRKITEEQRNCSKCAR